MKMLETVFKKNKEETEYISRKEHQNEIEYYQKKILQMESAFHTEISNLYQRIHELREVLVCLGLLNGNMSPTSKWGEDFSDKLTQLCQKHEIQEPKTIPSKIQRDHQNCARTIREALKKRLRLTTKEVMKLIPFQKQACQRIMKEVTKWIPNSIFIPGKSGRGNHSKICLCNSAGYPI